MFYVLSLLLRRPPRSTLFSLHDALPIFAGRGRRLRRRPVRLHAVVALDDHEIANRMGKAQRLRALVFRDRKSTRLNSSHANISYAVFCLKKKKNHTRRLPLLASTTLARR